MMKFIIKLANLDDVDELFVLANRAFNPSPWPKKIFANLINAPRGQIKIVVLEGKIVSFLGYTTILDEQHVDLIATDPNFQGQGLAKKLLQSIEEDGITRLLLEADSQNQKAVKLYESLDYTEYYRRKNYYSNGNDAILMEKQL